MIKEQITDLANLIAIIENKIMKKNKLNNIYKLKLAQDNSNSDLSGLLYFCGRE